VDGRATARLRPGTAGFGSRDQTLGAGYAVTLDVFEGPLDLLLHLIEREELDISEVSLVQVTDPYLRTLAQLEEIVPGALADFLVVASRLVYLKSSRLLPKPPLADEGEDEEGGDSLVRHLLEYRQYKQAAGTLRGRQEGGLRVYVRPPGGTGSAGPLPRLPDFGDVDVALLHAALRRALQRMPVDAPAPKLHPYAVTVAEQIEIVRRRFGEAQRLAGRPVPIRFDELLDSRSTRLEIVVTFLAVLELIKQQELAARQDGTFGEIVLVVAPERGVSAGV
jgi:segregation and condensation protein A